ncbi:DotH/IcmK family type IV secretion protein [Enterobacter hormaechei]|uniref:DotH/IcmK family type IV secretion protein n=1 Tax=Enterobacter hormaechei TaxID=158836 RepID=UPI00388E3797
MGISKKVIPLWRPQTAGPPEHFVVFGRKIPRTPIDASKLKTDNKRVSVWRRADKLYVRSVLESRTQFSKTLSSADGTHVYEMEISPFITMMEQGSTITVKVEL